jgi:hypothetical protein
MERPAAWGTTGLPWQPAWVWGIEALGCVGRGFDEAAWGAAGGLSEFDYISANQLAPNL